MKMQKTLIFRILLLSLIALTLVFIAVQSLLPPEISNAESEAVGEIIEVIIPSDTPTGAQVQKNVRNIGHFVEFAVLGTEVALYVFFFERKLLCLILAPVLSPLAALLDETLQYVSDRAPDIADVWMDTLGFLSLYLVVVGIAYATNYIIKRTKNKNGENNIG